VRSCRNSFPIELVFSLVFLLSFSYEKGFYYYEIRIREVVNSRLPWGEREKTRFALAKVKLSVREGGEGVLLPLFIQWEGEKRREFNKEYLTVVFGETWVEFGKKGLKVECTEEGEWTKRLGERGESLLLQWRVEREKEGWWRVEGSAEGEFKFLIIPLRRRVDFWIEFLEVDGVVRELKGGFSSLSGARRLLGYGSGRDFLFTAKLTEFKKRLSEREGKEAQRSPSSSRAEGSRSSATSLPRL